MTNKQETSHDFARSLSNAELANARCPECGDRVILPNVGIREAFGGDKSPHDPHVWCADHGHWIGYLSECKTTVANANITGG